MSESVTVVTPATHVAGRDLTLLLAMNVIWGLNLVACKVGVDEFPPVFVTATAFPDAFGHADALVTPAARPDENAVAGNPADRAGHVRIAVSRHCPGAGRLERCDREPARRAFFDAVIGLAAGRAYSLAAAAGHCTGVCGRRRNQPRSAHVFESGRPAAGRGVQFHWCTRPDLHQATAPGAGTAIAGLGVAGGGAVAAAAEPVPRVGAMGGNAYGEHAGMGRACLHGPDVQPDRAYRVVLPHCEIPRHRTLHQSRC